MNKHSAGLIRVSSVEYALNTNFEYPYNIIESKSITGDHIS